jgi:hypothetical protein
VTLDGERVRRALVARWSLGRGSPDVTAAGRRLLAYHATDPATLTLTAGVSASFDSVAERVLDALGDRDATVTELYDRVPELAARFDGAPGKSYGAPTAVGGRLLDAMGASGQVVRARARGSWKQSTCSWARLDRWLPDLPPPPPAAEAHRQLVRRYLEAFGPATVDDVVWWTGLAKGPIRAALTALGDEVVEVEVPGWSGPRVALRSGLEDLQAPRDPAPVAFLPALDPSVMGYADRDWFLAPEHKAPLYDRSGNTAPTVWWDGAVVGAWAQPKDGAVRYRAFRPAPEGEVAAAARVLEAALAGDRVAPRFPTPVVKELAG